MLGWVPAAMTSALRGALLLVAALVMPRQRVSASRLRAGRGETRRSKLVTLQVHVDPLGADYPWQLRLDMVQHRPFYWNAITGESQWWRPPRLGSDRARDGG